jgi:four helix bundle protein
MRDHRKLKAFSLADRLVVEVYQHTATFPKQEAYGLVSQIRRAAVSVPTNIVEGCARKSQAEYAHFLNQAFGSLREVGYLLDLSRRLGFLAADSFRPLHELYDEAARTLSALLRSLS